MRIIIVGAGEIGNYFAEWLSSEQNEVVVIDSSEQSLKQVTDHLDVQTLHGSGSSPKVLEEAGIKRANIILAVTNSDEVNLIALYFANLLSPHIHKVALIHHDDYTVYQDTLSKDIFDISLVINPGAEVVNSILRLINTPDIEEINDFVGGRIKMAGKKLSQQSPLNGLKLSQLYEKLGENRLIIAAIVRDDNLIIPKGKDTLLAGDFVYFVCEQKDFENILKYFGSELYSVKNVMIIGGGKIGFRLAQELEKKKYNVKLIEMDHQRCQTIAAQLHDTVVLHGYATDQAFMVQENVGSMDMVIAVTWDEEINILSCLLAKRLGVKKTVARVNKLVYVPLVHAIGIDHIISPRRCAIDSITPLLHRGKVISTVFIKGKEAEVLEAIALENSGVVDTPLKEFKFPKETLVLCLVRGDEIIMPDGNTTIHPNDRVIILSTRKNMPRIEQYLAIKNSFF